MPPDLPATGRKWSLAETGLRREAGSICELVELVEHAENHRNHIYVRTQTRSCDQASPSESMACGHHCFLCLSEQSKGTVSPSETSFTALNAISSSLTVCPCPSPQLSPSYSKQGLQCTCGRHERGGRAPQRAAQDVVDIRSFMDWTYR